MGVCQPSLLKYTAHLRCRYAKSVHPCTLLAASFGCTETSRTDRRSVVPSNIEFFV